MRDGQRVGRYDKIHLVPFGEYIPFQPVFFFAHKLTGEVPNFSHGTRIKVFFLKWRIATASSSATRRCLRTR